MPHSVFTLADESLPWIEGGQWAILAISAAIGAAVLALGLTRRRLAPELRRCPSCRFDMRSTPSRRCGECGHVTESEWALHHGHRLVPIAILGVIIVLVYPAVRSIAWSRDRGWTPPLPAWKIDQAVVLPNGAVAELLEKRSPWEFDQKCRLRAVDGSIQIIETGFHLTLGTAMNDDASRFIGLGEDITGNGVANLVVADWSGGAHCCLTLYIYELPSNGGIEEYDVIQVRDGGSFDDLDGDGALEIVTYDWSLAYALTCFACLDYPDVILRPAEDGYVVAADMMRRDRPTDEAITAIIARVRADDWNSFEGRDHLWGSMLELIYTGHASLAWRLFEAGWLADNADRDEALASFKTAIEQSPYHAAVVDLQYTEVTSAPQ